MRFYTVSQLGPLQSLTPEGFLLCQAVPVGRTGTMLYLGTEIPVIEPGPDGIIRIERSAEDLFRPATMASFEGKPVTLDHPDEDVSPENWTSYAKGIATNLRRGSGVMDEFLLADLLVMDQAAIAAITSERIREVSLGYDAEYEQVSTGRGRQYDIAGNHIALVEKGRCGARCSIGDQNTVKNKWLDKLRSAFTSRDEAAFEETLKQDPEKTADESAAAAAAGDPPPPQTATLDSVLEAVNALGARVSALETPATAATVDGATAEESDKKDDDEDKEKTADEATAEESDKKDEDDEDKKEKEKTNDSAALVNEARDVFARAEILAPGIHVPTFDAAADPQKTRDSLCALRRKALTVAYNGSSRDALQPILAGRDLKTLTCDTLAVAFDASAELVRRTNNAAQTTVTRDAFTASGAVANSISEINRRNTEFWQTRR